MLNTVGDNWCKLLQFTAKKQQHELVKLDKGLTVVLKVSLFSSTDPDGKSSRIKDQVGNKTHLLGFRISLVGPPPHPHPLSANELLVGEWKEKTQQPSISTVVYLMLVCFCQFKLIPIPPQGLTHQIKAGCRIWLFFHLFSFIYLLSGNLKKSLLSLFLTLLWSTCGGDVLIFSADPLQLCQLG